MDLSGKNVLVLGLGITGVSTIKTLHKLGANIILNDSKTKDELGKYIKEIRPYPIKSVFGTNDIDLKGIDIVIKSPGIPSNIPIIKKANRKNIEVITDIELAYRLKPTNPMVAITGTNGKTTATTLTGKFFKNASRNCHVVGNIGVGILENLMDSKEEDIFIIETSSFQLDGTSKFKPKISLILNITPDHIDWHGSYDKYIGAKKKVFLNQGAGDYTILNYDDSIVKKMAYEAGSNIFWFSVYNVLDKGAYIKDGNIVINDGRKESKVISTKDIKIPGNHNLENILASISIAWLMGLDIEHMSDILKSFKGLEHRIEYVTTIEGVSFYNDSKATNPVSSIEAVKALEESVILIAGGMDKGADYKELMDSFKGRVKSLILLGETAEKIERAANKKGFKDVFIVENMKDAVYKGFKLAESKDKILLSPACASWDMYPSYQDRGLDFKRAVFSLEEELNG